MQHIDISKFTNKRVLIVGDIILDEFIQTTSERNSAEYKDIPILKIKEKKSYLGGAANVALNLKQLHAIPYLVGCIGDDANGATIEKLLQQAEISIEYIYRNHTQKTTVKTRIFKDNRPIFRLDDECDTYTNKLHNAFILRNITNAIQQHKPHILLLQDYNKGVLNQENISEIIQLAKQHQMLICVDPKFENWDLYQDVDLFKPNEKELNVMRDTISLKNDSFENISKVIAEKINCKNLLVTLGAKGNFIYNSTIAKHTPLHTTIENADVCGAGDTVIAVASLALAAGFSLEQIAILSNQSGFIVCQKEHTQPICFNEIMK